MSSDAPLALTLYVASLAGGGAERLAAVLATGFHAAGHRVQVLVDHAGNDHRDFLDRGIVVTPLGARHAGSVVGLARHLARREADVVLGIGGAANLKLVAARVLSGGRTPVVLSFHGRSDVGRGRLGAAAFSSAPVLTRLASHTVCVSEALVRHLVDDWRAAPDRVSSIPNAIPVERARPAASAAELRARPPVILAVGRLVPEKQFDTLIRAVARLGSDARLILLGDGPERNALQALADRLGLADRVTLPGYAAEPWDAYAGARVFALTSRSEGFGNVVVEALASGLPIVATDCGGPREILGDGQWGRLVPVGDDDALVDALTRALADPGDPAPRVARAARYQTQRVVAEYLDLFRRVARG